MVNMYAKSVKAYVSLEANTVDSLIVGLLQPPVSLDPSKMHSTIAG